MENKIIDKPLRYLIKKGKSHYICMKRLKNYISQKYNKYYLSAEKSIDLDNLDIPKRVKNKINIDKCNKICNFSNRCILNKKNNYMEYDFIITNHNYLIADIKNENEILNNTEILIIDEVHKLYKCAENMYITSLGQFDVIRAVKYILKRHDNNNKFKNCV